MKTTMKYTKWLLAAAVLCTAPVFTSCDNDDDVVITPLPEKFCTVLSSLSVDWNETEGVVDFEAPGKWKAESACEWIEVDPTSGTGGEHRLWLSVTPNPYMLPRSGEIHITCGDEYGKIVVTQAGAPAENVAPASMSLEVLSLDYATEELSFASAASDILGNLGLTLEEFSKGVSDTGDLEFFMIDKNGQWVSGGTAGTRCSAWLDKDLNVTWWDGNGYPSNAAFIEVYGGVDDNGNVEEPTLVVGRAPGVPDNQEYDLKFGFTLANDHSKYTLFNVHVIFVPMDLKGTIVKTIDMTVNVEANDGYIPTPAVFDAADVAAALGASSITLAKVVSYDANGDFLDYTANNGYWFTQSGEVGSWGEGALCFIEYWGGDEEDAETNSSWQVGPFPGVNNMSATTKIGFWYNNNVVMFNLNVVIGEGGGNGNDDPQAVDVVSFLELSVNVPANDGYVPVTLPFDASAVEAALGVPASECSVVSLNEDGSIISTTANNGYWYSMEGEVCGWGEGALCFIEYHGDEKDASDEEKSSFNVGPFPEATGSAVVQIGFMHDMKVVLYDVNVTVE